jgi:type II secretory pathway component PulK
LIGVLAAVASTEHLDVKAAANRKEAIKARMAAMSGIQRYIATIANDLAGGGATTTTGSSTSTSTIAQTTGASTLQDDWAQLGSNGDENVIVGDTRFRMQVVDACSFINLTKLTPTWLNNLPLSQQQIDAYNDFTTPGENATADGGKDPYYNGLVIPYNAKLAALDTLDELLQIRYFNAAAIWEPNTNIVSTVTFTAGQNGQQPTLYDLVTPYSYAPNVQPGPLGQQQPRISMTGQVTAQVVTRLTALGLSGTGGRNLVGRTFTSLGQLAAALPSINDKKIVLDACTFNPGTRISGLINLNTASQNVLSTLPGINPNIAQALVAQQQTGYTRLSDVLNIAGYNGAALTSSIDYLCVESSTFIVRVIGICGDTSIAMEGTVDIINNTPRLTRLADVPFTDVLGRWNWNSTTSTDTTLKEAS